MTAGTAAAIAGLVLGSFGNLGELLKKSNPWRGFQSEGPNLVSVRAQRVDDAACKPWVNAFLADGRGIAVGSADNEVVLKKGLATWEPWIEDDLDAVKDCDDFPCDVKVNKAEAEAMKLASEDTRLARFLSIVSARARSYVTTGERKEYEFPGDPVDPWAYVEKLGLKSAVSRPAKPDLWVRKVNLDPKRMKTLHQILDRRAAKSPTGTEATLWVRDAYTDHYFDGWGEWATVVCDSGGVTLVQALFLEVDLLKKNDLFSRIGRGKLRSAIEENGAKYLNATYERVREAASATVTK